MPLYAYIIVQFQLVFNRFFVFYMEFFTNSGFSPRQKGNFTYEHAKANHFHGCRYGDRYPF